MGEWPEAGLGQMYRLIDSLPAQLTASSELSGLAEIPPLAAGGRHLVLCGMGGSAIAGDLVRPLLANGQVSLTVWRDYGLPHWVTADDLVLCCSYSGDTEETLSGAVEAGARGCQRVAITSGGRLAQLGAGEHFPVVGLPGDLPPRASLGYGLGAVIRVLDRLGIIDSSGGRIQRAVEVLQHMNDSRREPMTDGTAPPEDAEGNISPAALAEILAGRVPVIYTAGREAHGVGLRWKAQLNENSKMPAMVVPFPEVNHNDLVGWCLSPDQKAGFVLLIVRSNDDNARIAQRVDITRELLWDEFADIHEIRSTADSQLGRILSLVQYGDYLSCHLARLNGVDPIPVTRITKLKNALS